MGALFVHTGEVDGIRRIYRISVNDLGASPRRVKELGTGSEIFLSSN